MQHADSRQSRPCLCPWSMCAPCSENRERVTPQIWRLCGLTWEPSANAISQNSPGSNAHTSRQPMR